MDQKAFNRIDTHDFIWYVIQKWKTIIIATLVLAIMFGVVFEVKTLKNANVSSEKELESLKVGLTSEEISKVESSAKTILNYRNMYNLQKNYIDNSIFQSIDPYNINSVSLEYYVDNDYEVVYPVVDKNNSLVPIIQAYASLIRSDELYEKMQDQIDSTQTISNFSELVFLDTAQQEYGIFSIVIYANDSSISLKMAEIIEGYLSNSIESVCENYEHHTLELTSKTEKQIIDTSVAEKQQLNLNNLYEISNSIKKEESLYADQSLIYLQALIHEQLVEEESVIKYVVLGALAGLVVSAIIIIMTYLLSGKIRSVDEISINSNVEFVGELYEKIDSKNAIDEKIAVKRKKDRNKTLFEDRIEILSSEITCLLEKKKKNRVGFVLADADEKSLEYINLINKKISKDFDVSIIGDFLCDASSLTELSKQEEVVLFEHIDKSKFANLKSKMIKCDEFDVDVLGIILIS